MTGEKFVKEGTIQQAQAAAARARKAMKHTNLSGEFVKRLEVLEAGIAKVTKMKRCSERATAKLNCAIKAAQLAQV